MRGYAAPPDGALTWRFKSDLSGSGVLGDLASHGVDLGRHLVGEITDLLCDTATFITQRRQVDMTVSHFSRGTGGPMGAVENEDYARRSRCPLLGLQADGRVAAVS